MKLEAIPNSQMSMYIKSVKHINTQIVQQLDLMVQ